MCFYGKARQDPWSHRVQKRYLYRHGQNQRDSQTFDSKECQSGPVIYGTLQILLKVYLYVCSDSPASLRLNRGV